MSQYPYGHGHFGHGHFASQPFQYPYYPYQNSPATYAPPVYGSPPDPRAADPHYHTPSGIPGLGTSGTPVVANPYNLPGIGPRGQGQVPGAPFMASAPGPLARQYPAVPSASDTTPHINQPNLPAAAASHSPRPEPPKPSGRGTSDRGREADASASAKENQKQASDDMEEGELSDGQFEDLYEPKDTAAAAAAAAASQAPDVAESSIVDSNRGTCVVNTPDAGFYVDAEDAVARSAQNERTEGRERSGSYSPYLSPTEIQPDRTPHHADSGHDDHPPSRGPSATQAKGPPQALPGLQYASQVSNSQGVADDPPHISPSLGRSAETPGDNGLAFSSVETARKEAQKAILRLWPLGVKYQNYIDEGFDEKVIKPLFEALHLDISAGKSRDRGPRPEASASEAPSKPQPQATSTSKPSSDNEQPSAKSQGPAGATKPDMTDKSEERKDRIARLLAAKSAKPTTSRATPPATAKPAEIAGLPPKPKTREEKELLLQQKMEALRRSRQARAQKTAPEADATTSQPGAADNASGSATAEPVPESLVPAQPSSNTDVPPSADAGPVQEDPGEAALPPSAPARARRLSVSLTPQPAPPTNQRKRPVALDFVDLPSASGRAKRPFGQERQDSYLVIDVSDASDEEMDIDVDQDSPAGSPAKGPPAESSARGGLSFRDFPPLSDTPQRLYASPAPSNHTPPASLGNSNRPETELDRKEREIQEMRRRIAEAMAKRNAKKAPAGSQTPNGATATPPDAQDAEGSGQPEASEKPVRDDTPTTDRQTPDVSAAPPSPSFVPAKLPGPAEARVTDSCLLVGRRGRVASSDISRLDDNLQEKMNRLRQLREEQESLQAEIDRGLAEKSRLASELDRLDDTVTAEAYPEDGRVVEEASHDPQPASASPGASPLPGSLRTPSEGVSGRSEGEASEGTTPREAGRPRPPSPLQARPSGEASSQDSADKERDGDGRLVGDGGSAGETTPPSERSADTPQTSAAGIAADLEEAAVPVFEATTDSDAAEKAAGTDTVMPDAALPDAAMPDTVMSEPDPTPPSREDDDGSQSDAYEPPEPIESGKQQDASDHMSIESSSFSPEPASSASVPGSPVVGPRDAAEATTTPARISNIAHPREATQEAEGSREVEGAVSGEVTSIPSQQWHTMTDSVQEETEPEPKAPSSFVPYETPLHYFRAFRFHPGYGRSVPGGLKSLTYSSRIDPNKQLCPAELSGQSCDQGASCQYQHLSSIAAPDDQILLELGKADDYTGEQRSRFIQGLKELLQSFRANKVKDFETIAKGIIEFRARFLGDRSKILQLDGITV